MNTFLLPPRVSCYSGTKERVYPGQDLTNAYTRDLDKLVKGSSLERFNNVKNRWSEVVKISGIPFSRLV